MRPLKNFEEFVKRGIIKKRTPDIFRAKSLIGEAEKRDSFLKIMSKKIKLSDDNANYFIENSYDLLISTIRANLLIAGFKASGEGAHEAEVSFMRELAFTEKEVRFMNELRHFRNGILYYGKTFDSDYAIKVLQFKDDLFPKLRSEFHSKKL